MRPGFVRPDPVRTTLMALAALSAGALGLVTFAANRLVSGKPVGLAEALTLPATPWPLVLAVAAGLAMLAGPLLPAKGRWNWLLVAASGLFAAALLWWAGECALALAGRGSPSARTGLGAGTWVLLGVALLLAQDSAARLKLGLGATAFAGILVVAPIALVIALGGVERLSLAREYANQREIFAPSVLRHLEIVAVALVPTLLAGIVLGVVATRRPGLAQGLYPVLNVVQTIPSIAMFGLLIAPLSGLGAMLPGLGISGIGLAPAVIALFLYSLLPIVRNTQAGLEGVPAAARDAAAGMGMTPRQLFWQVEIPLALPVFLAGLRITTVQAIGLTAVAALIGAGGLGEIMFRGLFANAGDLVLLGAIPIILLAVLADFALRLLSGLVARQMAPQVAP
jgi:osmoprotectant transport system permease protein